jgi:hypothetical protein
MPRVAASPAAARARTAVPATNARIVAAPDASEPVANAYSTLDWRSTMRILILGGDGEVVDHPSDPLVAEDQARFDALPRG